MFFQHIYDKTLAQASYFIGCQKAGVAAVIDPKRDVDTYLDIAKANKMTITHIFETHIHADFLSGSRELSALTGASMYLSDEGGEGWLYEFPHAGLKDGDQVEVGNLTFQILHTPGHTPESISLLLTDNPSSAKPVMLFTGDFVFVGDVGRPDLLEKAAGMAGTADSGAKQLYRSIGKFMDLPDYIQVWPGHGAGSACGKALGSVPSSTVGYEKIRNWAFNYQNDERGFVNYLLSDQPEPPRYFAKMKELNKSARPLLTEVPKLKLLTANELDDARAKGMKVVDTRSKNDFAMSHIPGSLNIQGNNSFATWAGWFLKYDEPFMLIAAEDQLDDLTRKLMRIGLDNIYGYIPSPGLWEAAGGTLDHYEPIGFEETKAAIDQDALVIDLRGEAEYRSGHLPGAKHVFVGTLPDNLREIPNDRPVVIHCQGGDRAAIAHSILLANGYKNVTNYTGGINDWVTQSGPLVS